MKSALCPQLYIYSWGNNQKRQKMKGRECYIVATGARNSVVIQFTDSNQREVVSRRALRKKTLTTGTPEEEKE